MSPVLQRTGGVLNRSPRGAPHESLSAEGDKASPLVLACSHFESIPRYDFLGIFTSHKSKGRCGSFGIARGKNDKIDAIRLCKYACKESDELKMSKPLNPKLMQLKDLQTSRTRLLSQKNANQTYLKELNDINDKATQKALKQVYKTAIEGLGKSIIAIEKLIKELIKSDDSLQKSYDLLLSVPGIGNITAIYLIVCTNNFTGNISGKQLASYAGVAPFGNSSGTSIKKPEKVHKMANKEPRGRPR